MAGTSSTFSPSTFAWEPPRNIGLSQTSTKLMRSLHASFSLVPFSNFDCCGEARRMQCMNYAVVVHCGLLSVPNLSWHSSHSVLLFFLLRKIFSVFLLLFCCENCSVTLFPYIILPMPMLWLCHEKKHHWYYKLSQSNTVTMP